MDDGLVLLEAQARQHGIHAVRAEDAHEIILQGQEELGAAGVALTAAATTQLVVDAAALVALGAHDVEAARRLGLVAEHGDFRADRGFARLALGARLHGGAFVLHAHVHIAAELDVGAATGHVGGDGDGAGHARLRHDIGFLLVEARVQHREEFRGLAVARGFIELQQPVGIREVDQRIAMALHEFGELLGLLDGRGAHQHGLQLLVRAFDLAQDRLQLFLAGAIDLVILVEALHRAVGGDLHHIQPVDFGEFVGLRGCGAGHARQLLVETEVVLEGDGGQRHILGLDLHMFLGFQRLMQAFRITAAGHHASREFVDDDEFAIADDIVLVLLEQRMGLQRLLHMMDDGDIGRVIERAFLEEARFRQQLLHVLVARFRQIGGALLLVHVVIRANQFGNQHVDLVVEFGLVVRGA